MKSAGKARNNGLYRHIRTSKEIIRNLLNDSNKSSDYWEFVLVELEDAKKKIFTNDKENIYFHSEFNHAYDQITSWKAYVNKNREAILHQIDKLRVPLNENSVRFKYVLVIGRNAEKDNSEKRRAMFAEKSDNDIRVMTYDSLFSQ